MPGTEHVPPPNPSECPWHCGKTCSLHCADYIDYVLEKEGDVAAVIAETVRSTPYIPPPEYWKRVRAACDRHGALLILDEIPHALGRTGKMFTVEHYDIVPDMLVIGKGLGGGIFPLAALIAREGLDVVGEKALGHFTHEKNPVACAAALATIDFIEAENLLAHVVELGAYAIDRLNTMRMTYPIIGDVRGIGLMMGVEIDHENASDVAESIMYSALARGLSFKLTMGNILLLVPALTLTREEMDAALEILTACFEEIV
jgi:4-aminobutyrate aminotransferase